jgi:hypothetical protein
MIARHLHVRVLGGTAKVRVTADGRQSGGCSRIQVTIKAAGSDRARLVCFVKTGVGILYYVDL